MYGVELVMPSSKDNFYFEGFMMPVREGFLVRIYNYFFSEGNLYQTQPITYDNRVNHKPIFIRLTFKLLKSRTFIKDLYLVINNKTNFLISLIQKYFFIIAFFTNLITLGILNIIYLVLISIYLFYEGVGLVE